MIFMSAITSLSLLHCYKHRWEQNRDSHTVGLEKRVIQTHPYKVLSLLHVDNFAFVLPSQLRAHRHTHTHTLELGSNQRWVWGEVNRVCVIAVSLQRLKKWFQVLTGSSPHTPSYTELVADWAGHVNIIQRLRKRHRHFCPKGDDRPRSSLHQVARLFDGLNYKHLQMTLAPFKFSCLVIHWQVNNMFNPASETTLISSTALKTSQIVISNNYTKNICTWLLH